MELPYDQYYAELRAQAIRERPFAVSLVEPWLFRRKGPQVYALLFKSANKALLYWVCRWLFEAALGISFVLLALNAWTYHPLIFAWPILGTMAGILRFMAERVDAPAGSDLLVGTRVEQALVICRIGPTAIHISTALAWLACLAAFVRVSGIL